MHAAACTGSTRGRARSTSSQPDCSAPTDLAVSPSGTVYVTELFGGRVVKVTSGGLETVVELPEPAAVEFARGQLYVAYDVFGSGKVGVFDR